VPGPKRVWQKQKTSEKIVSQIDRLLNHHVHPEIADILNKSGLLSLRGRPFTAAIVDNIQRQYGLKSRYERLRENNMLTLEEISNKMQISKVAVKKLEKSNMIKSYNCTDKRKKLYECPDNDFIEKLPEIFKGGAV
jgi:DNA-directed RNA polymerase sigma subunit (sigma70/sigma32)